MMPSMKLSFPLPCRFPAFLLAFCCAGARTPRRGVPTGTTARTPRRGVPTGTVFLLAFCCAATMVSAAEPTGYTASQLAANLGAAIQDGDSAVRLRLKIDPISGGEKSLLQVQIKARRTQGKSEIVYQVLWPNERKGESFLISQAAGRSLEGQVFVPPDKLTKLDPSRMLDPVFGSDLSYQDVIENFFLWSGQSFAGKENVDRVDCVILESSPGPKDVSPYGKVRSWIDLRRMVAMRVEKYDRAGRLLRRIETTQVIKDDTGRHLPSELTVSRAGSSTVTGIDGSNIRHDVQYSDQDFTAQALANIQESR